VLILDEPGNGLDPQGIRALRDLLRAHAAEGGTVFVSSHLLSEVEHLADDVIVINQGRLITQGSLAELQQGATLVRCDDPQRLAGARERRRPRRTPRPDELVVRGMPIDEVGERAFVAGIPCTSCRPAPARSRSCSHWTSEPSPMHTDRRPHDRHGGRPVMTAIATIPLTT
jgi:ABC-2 type transport system ATP-binding protein